MENEKRFVKERDVQGLIFSFFVIGVLLISVGIGIHGIYSEIEANRQAVSEQKEAVKTLSNHIPKEHREFYKRKMMDRCAQDPEFAVEKAVRTDKGNSQEVAESFCAKTMVRKAGTPEEAKRRQSFLQSFITKSDSENESNLEIFGNG